MYFEANSEITPYVFREVPFSNNQEPKILKVYCKMTYRKVEGLLQLLSQSQVFEKSEKQTPQKAPRNKYLKGLAQVFLQHL